jgi:protein-S-isoprenylcysteine O-methyltransferase Ste14
MTALRTLDWPPVWLLAALALTWGFDRLIPWGLFGPMGQGFGPVLAVAGLVLMAVAAAQMVLSRTSFIPRRDPAALVTTGAFALSRNPIYLGDLLVLAGAILYWDVPVAVPVLFLFVAIIQARFILGEEARLRARFPDAYRQWSARVPRWFGLPLRRMPQGRN